MARVSRNRLKPDILEGIYEMLLRSMVLSRDRNESFVLISGLMSKPERIMIAKRFAACVLLNSGVLVSDISAMLKMSRTTISKLSRYLEQNQSFSAYLSKNFKLELENESASLLPIEQVLRALYRHKKHRYG